MTMRFMKRPCPRCPWRKDVEPGDFDVERFQKLAETAYDAAEIQFACHKSTEGKDAACAGFLLKNADNNLGTRFGIIYGDYDPALVSDGGHALFANYREMAIHHGVEPDDPCLIPCRANDD